MMSERRDWQRTFGKAHRISGWTMGLNLLAGGLGLAGTAAAGDDEKPNIIFIFTDDHAQQAISAYDFREDINETPNLDRLAQDGGMLFHESFVANSICAPSRATLWTGKHSHLNGQTTNAQVFDGEQQTFPKLLQEAGYATAMIGKWHLRSDPTGFDYWDILPGQGNYYNPQFITEDGRYQEMGYVTDIITDKTLDWMGQKHEAGEPFVVMSHHKAPHRNWKPGPDHLTTFDDVEIPEPPNLFDDYEGRGTAAREQHMEIDRHMHWWYDLKVEPHDEIELHPNGHQGAAQSWMVDRLTDEQRQAWVEAYEPKNEAFFAQYAQGMSDEDIVRWKYQRYVKDYLRTIASVDDNVGRILDYLEENDMADDTIVVYASDQGFYLGEHGWYDKRFIYEESMRTPLIVRWPGLTDGSENTDLVQNIDWAPTLLEMAGVDVPADMQGRSLAPLLEGQTPGDWRQSLYYHYYELPGPHNVHRHYGVRDDRYKLAHFYQVDEWELYDLEEDPREMTSVYDDPDYAQVRDAMKQELLRLQEQYEDHDAADWVEEFGLTIGE